MELKDLLDIKEIKDICQEIADVYKAKMDQAGYDKQGELYNFKWVTEVHGELFELYFQLPDYWIYAEEGRKPGGFPPPDKILQWIQHKQLVPRPGRNGKVPSTSQLVYLISRKIATKGMEGKHLLEQTIDETYDTLVDQLVIAITDELEKEIENDINEL